MWTVVYIAPNQPVAESLRDLLQDEGIMAILRPLGGSGGPAKEGRGSVELLVPESEAEEATEVLNSAIGL